jgi:hypothetical protein
MSTQKADTVPSKDSNTLQAKASHTPEMMQRALRHAFHRDHGYMEFCDACKESKDLLTLAAESFNDMLAALKDMVEIAQQDDWHNALSGRQIVLEAAEKAVAKAEKSA